MSIRARGFTLIEILVAMLILGFGLLGVAGLQVLSLQSSDSVLNRSQATLLAYDLAERVRVNPEAANSGDYDNLDSTVLPPSTPDCIINGCTTDKLAQQDIREWLEHFTDVTGIGLDGEGWQPALPEPKASLSRTPGTSAFQITISWTENHRGQQQQTNTSYQMDFSL